MARLEVTVDAVDLALARVRRWIVGAFVVQSLAGTAIAIDVIDVMKRTGAYGDALASHEPAGTIAWTLAALLGVLLVLLWLFEQLMRRQAWARVVLLVLGWVSAVSAAISVASSPLSGAILERFVPDAMRGGLASMAAVSLLTNAIALASWGYLIWTLQFREDVRAAFLPCRPPASTPQAPLP